MNQVVKKMTKIKDTEIRFANPTELQGCWWCLGRRILELYNTSSHPYLQLIDNLKESKVNHMKKVWENLV